MSDNQNTKNTTKSSRSARSRLHAEQLRRRRAHARRRKAGIAAAITAILLGGGTALAIGTASGGAEDGRVTMPANASGTDGTVIVYGRATAPDTLDVWEDFRCPYCGKLEKADGKAIQRLADTGVYKIHYHMGTFLDGNLGGHGSTEALQAAGAALNEGAARFKAFHDVLYAGQPDERTDGFADQSRLLALAAKVPGLTTPAFVQAVKDRTYAGWAHKVSDAFNRSGVDGTPTLKLNGRPLAVLDGAGNPIAPARYTALVQQSVSGRSQRS
ncbi:DsbA family protein [Actinoallomurus iriomotensis]|uniref:Thioredoxin-like fold domain-containing protein n=1 Tax=Actinoallomurus iriomotensis TaxID=478107 RepID=A0A9W6VJS9_9ACTN|nr:thioredoxin domain-containing protein [Actinoallomurus iriomotensis]GLY74408.1 hypothetical protein Airi01_026750 [Actinoallomurus iriomotensis]